jgi:hypothetical protein
VAVTADWFADVGEPEQDPFGPRVEAVGRPIDLAGDTPALNKRLIALLQQEDDLERAGTSCVVRAMPDSTCSACPLRQTDPLDRLTALCTVGVSMERTLTAIAINRAQS